MQKFNLDKYKLSLKEILNKGAYPKSFQDCALKNPVIRELSIYINNICNLRCKHCSCRLPSGQEYLKDQELTIDELARFIENVSSSLQVVAIVGREPFVNSKTMELLGRLNDLVQNGKKFRYGVVTNGTLLRPYLGLIAKNKGVNWVDVSVDGTEAVNDSIRGKGVFRESVNNLKEMVNNRIPPYVGVSICCHKGNYRAIPKLIKMLHAKIGLRNISLVPFVYTGFNEQQSFISSKDDFIGFIKGLTNSNSLSKCDINIFFDLEWFTIPLVKELVSENIFSIDSLELDDEGSPFVLLKKGKLNVFLRLTLLEMDKFLLMPDGYLGTMPITESTKYWELSGGNIRDIKISKELLAGILKRQFAHMNNNLKNNNFAMSKLKCFE